MGGGGSKSIIGFFPTEPNSYPRYSDVTIGERKGFDSQGLTKMKKGDKRWESTATSGICTDCKGDCPDGFVSFGHSLPVSATSDTLCQRDWKNIGSDRKIDCCVGNIMGVSTCPPGYSVGSNICLETMKDHCPSMIDGKLSWDKACDTYIEKAPPQQTNDLIETAVASFFSKHIIDETPRIPFGKTLQKLCGDRPGLCDNSLRSACTGTSRVLIEGGNSDIARYAQDICGCFLRDTPGFTDYKKYQGQVPKECDPICRAAKIQPGHREGPLWVKDDCKGGTCIIDNATLNLIDSTAEGMTVQQICGGDGKSAFECYIGDVEVDAIDSTIGRLKLCQECKGGVKVNPKQGQGTNAWVDYDCSKKLTVEEPDQSGISQTTIWGLVALLIVGVVVIYLRRRK
jgi:hypothetical protein